MAAAPLPEHEPRRLADLHTLGLVTGESDPALDAVSRVAAQLLDAPVALVSLVAERHQHFVGRTGLASAGTPREESFCAHAVVSEELFVVEDATADPRFADNPLVTGPPHIVFYAGAPVRGPQASVLGTVCVIDHRPRTLDDEEADRLRDLATLVDEVLGHRAVGITDALTGLYNRRGFDRAVEQAVALSDRGTARVTIAYADIDGLKTMNDQHGHAAGDRAIRRVALTLREEFRAGDVVGRLGGDEFGVILFDSPDPTPAFRRIAAALDDISISIAAVDHVRGEDAASVIERADREMYRQRSAQPQPPLGRGSSTA